MPDPLDPSPLNPTDETGGVLSPQYRAASLAIYTNMALVAFEGTAVAAALPSVGADLGRIEWLPWVVTSYLFASGIATVLAGPVIDSVGVRRVFRWAVVVFTIGGLGAGVAPSMAMLVAARLLQGFGSGLVVAVSLAAVGLVFPQRLVGRAYAANSTIWGVMGAVAPVLAAGMLQFLNWRWIFLVNLPLGALALWMGWSIMPGPTAGARRASFDPRGAVMVSVFTLSSIIAVDKLGLFTAIFGTIAIGMVVAYRRYARRATSPVIAPQLVFEDPYRSLGVGVGLYLTAAFAADTFTPLYVSAARGGGPVLTAWSVFFFVIGWTAGSNGSSLFASRLGEVTMMLYGLSLGTVGFAVTTALVFADAALPFIFFGLFVCGLGAGSSTNVGLTLIRAMTPSAQLGRASAAHQFVRNQGFTLGAALGGGVLLFVIGRDLGDFKLVERLLSRDPDVVVDGRGAAAVASGYGYSMLVATVLAALSIPVVMRLRAWIQANPEALKRHELVDEVDG